jgi:hypothetical protein
MLSIEQQFVRKRWTNRRLGIHSPSLTKFSVRQFEQDFVDFLISLFFNLFVFFGIQGVIDHFFHNASLVKVQHKLARVLNNLTLVISMLISRIAWLI